MGQNGQEALDERHPGPCPPRPPPPLRPGDASPSRPPPTSRTCPGIIGQERAEEAVRFAIGIRRYGYNLYALGTSGMGKHGFVRAFLERPAAAGEAALRTGATSTTSTTPRRPRALRLPAGRGPAAPPRTWSGWSDELRAAIPAVFESEDYRTRRKLARGPVRRGRASGPSPRSRSGPASRGSPSSGRRPGVGLAPLRDGEVMEPEEFQKLPEEEQERLRGRDGGGAAGAAGGGGRRCPARRAGSARSCASSTGWSPRRPPPSSSTRCGRAGPTCRRCSSTWPRSRSDVVDNADDFLPPPEGANAVKALLGGRGDDRKPSRRYQVNVLVTRASGRGAPVVYEDHPTHANLVGRVEHVSELGNLVTDFTLDPGRARCTAPTAATSSWTRAGCSCSPWPGTSSSARCARRSIRIESLGQALSLVTTASLEPEPIPLDVKVVLLGERQLYYLLSAARPGVPRAVQGGGRLRGGDRAHPRGRAALRAAPRDLRPARGPAPPRPRGGGPGDRARLAPGGRRRRSCRSTRRRWPTCCARPTTSPARPGRRWSSAAHVQAAIDAQVRRASRIRERIQEDIRRGTVLIDTAGRGGRAGERPVGPPARRLRLRPAQPDHRPGAPRATGASWTSRRRWRSAGRSTRRASSSSPASSGSASPPSGRSRSRRASSSSSPTRGSTATAPPAPSSWRCSPPSPSAAGAAGAGHHRLGQPARPGAADRRGEREDRGLLRRLPGGGPHRRRRASSIPASNVKHLMLRDDVVEAAEKGLFHVWPVETVDEAVELLTGLPAGERGADGRFPEGSVNRRVDDRLAAFAEKARNFGRGAAGRQRGEGGGPEAARARAAGPAPAGSARAAPRSRAAGLRWARPGAVASSPDSCSSRRSGGRPGPRSASASQGVPPFTGVALRFALAGVLLVALAPSLGVRLGRAPREPVLWLVNGVLSFCLSYSAVYWAEQYIPSGLAAVLFATYPLFVAALAHFLLPGERLAPVRRPRHGPRVRRGGGHLLRRPHPPRRGDGAARGPRHARLARWCRRWPASSSSGGGAASTRCRSRPCPC